VIESTLYFGDSGSQAVKVEPPNFWTMIAVGLVLLFLDIVLWAARYQLDALKRPFERWTHTAIWFAGLYLSIIAVTGLINPEKGTRAWHWITNLLTAK
jgi:hypothetical protein